MVKKVLVVGGSENAIDENNQDFHYVTLLQKSSQCDITNISIGGISSEEILYRTVTEVEHSDYDLVLILWVPIGRKWVYFADNNIDDFTLVNNGHISGFNKNSSAAHQYSKLHYAYFDNQYINVRQYLNQLLLLQNYFKAKNIPLIMFRGFEDYIDDLLGVSYSQENGFVNLSDNLKAALDFNNRPDYYILEKLNVLTTLLKQIDKSVWIDFENFIFSKHKVDLQQDGIHAGPITHNSFFKILIAELNNRKLL